MNAGWTQVATILSKREPKTPMAFFNRMLWVVTSIIVAPLYSNIDAARKPLFVFLGIGIGLALVIWVSVFSWFKPEHLLYGAETHFEKWKTTFVPGFTGDQSSKLVGVNHQVVP